MFEVKEQKVDDLFVILILKEFVESEVSIYEEMIFEDVIVFFNEYKDEEIIEK